MRLDEYDVLDLAGHLCGLSEDDYPIKTVNENNPDDEGDWETIEYEQAVEEALCDKFEITLTAFAALMTKLLPMVDIGTSPISGDRFKGFSIPLGENTRQFLLKAQIDDV
jgi:hypothetical protein